MSPRQVLAIVLAGLALSATGCRPRTRDDVPGRTETRSGVLEVGEAPPGGAPRTATEDEVRRVEPSDPQVPVAPGTMPAPADPDRPVETAGRADAGAEVDPTEAAPRRPLPGADDSPRPRWLPSTDRLSVIRAEDRDRNLGVVDAGRP